MQDERAQRRQVLDREEALERGVDAVGRVHEAAADALAQRARAEVDEADLVRLVQPAVGEGLAHLDAGERADAAVEALEVLDVDGRPDVDAVVEEQRHVVVALAARGAGGIRVRQLVDDRDARPALEQPVVVGLALGPAARAVAHERRALEAPCALLGRHAPVRLEVADHEIGALLGGQAGIAEHLVGLAHAGCRAEVEAQESAQVGRGGHASSVGRARGSNPASSCVLQTLGRVLSGVFARPPYGRGMDIFAVVFTLVLFGACAAFLLGIERL